MANTFKNYVSSSAVGTSETTIYTVPSSTTAVIIGCNIANVTSSQIRVTVKVTSNTASSADVIVSALEQT